jgi:hypothetical protein
MGKEILIMSTSLTFKLVLSAAGVIDTEASLLAAENAIVAYKADRETEESQIADAVHAQFDEYRGARQNMPALVNGALRYLNVQPANYKSLAEKVTAYIQANSDRQANKKEGIVAEPARTRIFGTKKGLGGGVCRWSDVPVEADETESK